VSGPERDDVVTPIYLAVAADHSPHTPGEEHLTMFENVPAPPAWVRTIEGARNLTGVGVMSLCRLLRDDDTAPPALHALADRVLDTSLYRVDRPRARTTDPETSQAAAERHRRPAKPGGVVHRILHALGSVIVDGDARGYTSTELTELRAIKGAWRRTSELLADGLVTVARRREYVAANDTWVDGDEKTRNGGRVLVLTDDGRTELARLEALRPL
jgi:hypothetical protein